MGKSSDFSGSLGYINIGELFQLLGANGSTGVLKLTSRYSENPGIAYLQDGNPVNAICGPLTGLDAIYSLFGWTEGEFEFKEEQIQCKKVIKKSRMEIVLEGSRMVDDGLIEKLGPVTMSKQTQSEESDSGLALPVIKGPMVDYMSVADEEDYSDGDIIVKQGKHGTWSWVVLDGVVEIRKETPSGQLPILRVGNGSFIGNISSYLVSGNVRSATCVAIGNVQLGVLDSQQLSMEYARLSPGFKKIIISLDKRVKQTTSRVVDVQSKKKIEPKAFMKNIDPFIKQGSNEEKIYKIEQGKAYIVRATKKGEFLLANLEEGDFVGAIPFMNMGHEPGTASVYPSEDFKASELKREDLLNEYNNLSSTFKNMIENFSSFVSVTSMLVCDYKTTSKKK